MVKGGVLNIIQSSTFTFWYFKAFIIYFELIFTKVFLVNYQ